MWGATAKKRNDMSPLGLAIPPRCLVDRGSIATELGCPPHVGFPPVSDRIADISGGPFRANNGLMHRSKLSGYSITASARTRIVSGMVIRRDFAVLRFTTRSNLAGRSMGRSVGLVPPKIRPT
jgi:hypothetical protein